MLSEGMKTGFLSEMSAMPIHGGGVTLDRILGHERERFDWIAKTLHFPHEQQPFYPASRSYHFDWWRIEKPLKSIVGCRLAYFAATNRLCRKLFARRVAAKLLAREPGILTSRILVCPQADITLLVLREFQKRTPLQYVTWIMDDHLLRWENGDWQYPRGYSRLMDRHLKDAHKVYVISPAMREFYLERFGVDSTVLCGPAEPIETSPVPGRHGEPLRLVYFGSLGRWQNDALELLAPALSSSSATLDVFTRDPESIPSRLLASGARHCAPISATEVLDRTRFYDSVVLPISFRDELRNMSYFNIATKFSECLASGIPTLLIGPSDAVMVRIARESAACAIVDQPSTKAVEAALRQLRDKSSRDRIVASEHLLLHDEFTPCVMRRRWRESSAYLFANGTSRGPCDE